jgi:hypothetical protein
MEVLDNNGSTVNLSMYRPIMLDYYPRLFWSSLIYLYRANIGATDRILISSLGVGSKTFVACTLDDLFWAKTPRKYVPVLAFLSSETVQGLALALERVDHVHGRDGLAAGVFRVRDGVADAIF